MLLPRVPWGAVFQRQDVLRGICAVLLACLCPCRSASRGSPGGLRSAAPHFTTLGFFFFSPRDAGGFASQRQSLGDGRGELVARSRSSELCYPQASLGIWGLPAAAGHRGASIVASVAAM